MTLEKKCPKCKETKSAEAFAKRKDRPIGLYSCCKECKAAYRMKVYRDRRQEDPVSLWCKNARGWAACRAKSQGVAFDLTQDDIKSLVTKACHKCTYCDKDLNFRVLKTKLSERKDSPSLDKVLPSLGYTLANTVVCCHRCNSIKNDATPEELQNLAQRVTSLTNIIRKSS